MCFDWNTQISHFPNPQSLNQNRQNFEGTCVGTNIFCQDTIKRSSNVEYLYKIFLQTDGICDEWVFWFLICTDNLYTCGCYFVSLFLEVNFVPLILIVFDYLRLSITLRLRVVRLTNRVTHSCTKCRHSWPLMFNVIRQKYSSRFVNLMNSFTSGEFKNETLLERVV